MKKYILIVMACLLMCSCVDTVLLPNDKTVDYWKTKADVMSMVNGVYATMAGADVMGLFVVWGDFRSDELVPVTTISNGTMTALTEINAANIQTDNAYSNWGSLYTVINNCNIVLKNAKGVMSVDPSYTEGDYNTDRSQMLALRALTYFYLVRNFRDVPFSEEAFMTSSQPQTLPNVAPDSVLNHCIADLKEAEQSAIDPSAYPMTDWRRCGWINRDAIDAILADIYLWRASVHHSAADYQQCVAYCDKVIASKQAQHVKGPLETTVKEYPLADGREAFNELFVRQNAEESIFELQFDGNNQTNTALCQMYYKYANNSSTNSYLRAAGIFGKVAANNVYDKQKDYRFYSNIYNAGGSDEAFDVRKMTTNTGGMINTGDPAPFKRDNDRTYDRYAQNYIFYRLSDVMLMKAEAMTQLATDDADIQLRQAFNLVQAVNSRSMMNETADSLKWNTYSSKVSMEDLVLKERLRELCFEGKRWYDLLRYNYRKMEGVEYGKTLYEQNKEGKNFVANSTEMRQLLIRKYTSGGAAISSKMGTEPYLYMPLPKSDVKLNPLLKQNPVYKDNKEYEKKI